VEQIAISARFCQSKMVCTSISSGKDSPSRIRVREAHKTGANILDVAGPICMIMLGAAVKTEELQEELAIKDISQIVEESLL
jgi:Fe-S oxidoreductase